MLTESSTHAVRAPAPQKVFRKKCSEFVSKLAPQGRRRSSAYEMVKDECSNKFQSIEDQKLLQCFFNAACRGHTKYMKQVIGSSGMLTSLWTGQGPFNVNVQNSSNTTALMCAAKFGQVEAVKYLLSKKADPNIADICGKTALHYATVAVEFKSDERIENPIIKALLHAGSDVAALDQNDMTPLEVSVVCGNASAQFALGAQNDADVTAVMLAIKAKQETNSLEQQEVDEDSEVEEDWSSDEEDTDVDSTESYSAYSDSAPSEYVAGSPGFAVSGAGLRASAVVDGPPQISQPEAKMPEK